MLFIGRWENGDCSIVSAPDKAAAASLLDEVGSPTGCEIINIPSVAIHLQLTKEGKLELESIDERTYATVWSEAYPELDKLDRDSASDEEIEAAVEVERTRIKQPDPNKLLYPTGTALVQDLYGNR